MQQQKGRVEKLKLEPSGRNTGISKDNVPKNALGATSKKCGFHSGIKFIGNPKKATQIKPFSFDARPKSEKVTAAKETEVKPLSSDSRSKPEMALNARKTEVKPLRANACSNTVTGEIIKKIELKPFYFELCPEADEEICIHEDGRTCDDLFAKAFASFLPESRQSTPKSEKVENTDVAETKLHRFEARNKPEKVQKINATEVKLLSSKIPQKIETVKTTKETDVKRFGSDVRPRSEKVRDLKENLPEANPSSSDVQPQTEKGLRRSYRAHTGLKFIPRKKGTVMKPFSFESRSSTLKPKPGSTEKDVLKDEK